MSLAAQLTRLRGSATRSFEEAFPTSLTIEGTVIAAATGALDDSLQLDSHGNLGAQQEIAFRVRRELLATAGLAIIAQKTQVVNNGRTFRVVRLTDREGDPCLRLICQQL